MKILIETLLLTPSLNKLTGRNGHWIKHNAVRKWIVELANQQVHGDLETQELKPPCKITVRRFSGRTLDRDNFVGGLKPMIDALVHLGIIKNDTKLMLEHGNHEQHICKDNPRMEITIEEVE